MEVANDIARAIDSGRYEEREALPAERALSTDFGVSRETMRKALKLLEAQGYLVSRQGRGTYVAPNALRDMHRSIDGWSDEAARNGRVASQKVLLLEVIAAPLVVQRALGVKSGTQIAHLKRIRLLDGTPVGVHDTYLALNDPARLTRAKVESAGSLYRLLSEDFGLTLTDAAESISAVAASGDEAAWLEVAPQTPLLRVERITVADDLTPVEFCEMKYAQSYSYDTVVRRRNITN